MADTYWNTATEVLYNTDMLQTINYPDKDKLVALKHVHDVFSMLDMHVAEDRNGETAKADRDRQAQEVDAKKATIIRQISAALPNLSVDLQQAAVESVLKTASGSHADQLYANELLSNLATRESSWQSVDMEVRLLLIQGLKADLDNVLTLSRLLETESEPEVQNALLKLLHDFAIDPMPSAPSRATVGIGTAQTTTWDNVSKSQNSSEWKKQVEFRKEEALRAVMKMKIGSRDRGMQLLAADTIQFLTADSSEYLLYGLMNPNTESAKRTYDVGVMTALVQLTEQKLAAPPAPYDRNTKTVSKETLYRSMTSLFTAVQSSLETRLNASNQKDSVDDDIELLLLIKSKISKHSEQRFAGQFERFEISPRLKAKIKQSDRVSRRVRNQV